MSAELAFLRRNSEVALAAQTQANAEAWVAKEPNNPAAQEALASAQANFLATSSTEDERKNAAKAASEVPPPLRSAPQRLRLPPLPSLRTSRLRVC